jgi:hypothetical protein
LHDLDLFACHKPEPKTMLCETTILLIRGTGKSICGPNMTLL